MKSAENRLPKFKVGVEKPWWNDHLEQAKDSIEAHQLWQNADKSMHGLIFFEKNGAKLRYKLALKRAKSEIDNEKFNMMAKSLVDKNQTEFYHNWKLNPPQ